MGKYQEAERELRVAGYSDSDAYKAIADECLKTQPNVSCVPQAAAYLEKTGKERKAAHTTVGVAALEAAIDQNAAAVETFALGFLAEAGADPEAIRQQIRQRLRKERCDGVEKELSRIGAVVATRCQTLRSMAPAEPEDERRVEAITSYLPTPNGRSVGTTVRLTPRPALKDTCYQAAALRYELVAPLLAVCGFTEHATKATTQAAAVERTASLPQQPLATRLEAWKRQELPYPFSIAFKFRPPMPDYGRGSPTFEQEDLRARFRREFCSDKPLELVQYEADAPADFVVEGALPEFDWDGSTFKATVAASLMDSGGKVLGTYAFGFRGRAGMGDGAWIVLSKAMAAVKQAVAKDLANQSERMLARTSANLIPWADLSSIQSSTSSVVDGANSAMMPPVSTSPDAAD